MQLQHMICWLPSVNPHSLEVQLRKVMCYGDLMACPVEVLVRAGRVNQNKESVNAS